MILSFVKCLVTMLVFRPIMLLFCSCFNYVLVVSQEIIKISLQ